MSRTSLGKFYNKYRRLEKKLINCGIQVGDPELRAFRFLSSAKICTQVRTNILTSAGNKFDLPAIYSAIQTLYPQRRDEGGRDESTRQPTTSSTLQALHDVHLHLGARVLHHGAFE